jgi:hypothetical protein
MQIWQKENSKTWMLETSQEIIMSHKRSLIGIEKAQCVLAGMKEGHSKAKSRKSCGVKTHR